MRFPTPTAPRRDLEAREADDAAGARRATPDAGRIAWAALRVSSDDDDGDGGAAA